MKSVIDARRKTLPTYLRVSAVARMLDVSPSFVRRTLLSSNKLRAVRWHNGGHLFIPLDSYLAFVAERDSLDRD